MTRGTAGSGHTAPRTLEPRPAGPQAPAVSSHRAALCVLRACSAAAVTSDSVTPVDCGPPGSSVHGILQARILEWVAMPSSRGSSRPRDRTHICLHLRHCRWILYPLGHLGSLRVCEGCANPARDPHSPGRVGGHSQLGGWLTGLLCMWARSESEAAPSPAQVPGDGAAALAWRHHPPGGDPAASQLTISESQWSRRALGFEPSKDGAGA